MNCETFREAIAAGEQSAESLAHLRDCASCLEVAAAADPENMFRSIGGDDLLPAGGVDAFVEDVMREVHLRSAESRFAPRRVNRSWWWAAAATFVVGVTSVVMVQREAPLRYVPVQTAVRADGPNVSQAVAPAAPLLDRQVVESYDAAGATIVEVPTDSKDDVKVVMVFDQSLPADL